MRYFRIFLLFWVLDQAIGQDASNFRDEDFSKNICAQTKDCLDFLESIQEHLDKDLQKNVVKILQDFQQLDLRNRSFLEQSLCIKNRKDLEQLEYRKKALDDYDRYYHIYLKKCANVVGEINDPQLRDLFFHSVLVTKENREQLISSVRNQLHQKLSDSCPIRKKEQVVMLDEEEINELFHYLSLLRHIPYRYPDEGCYARSQEMIDEAEQIFQITLGRIFLTPKKENQFIEVQTSDHPSGKVCWSYHVAPYLFQLKSGKKQVVVLDPSLFDHAVPVEEWIQRQAVDPSKYKIQYSKEPYTLFPQDISGVPLLMSKDKFIKANRMITQFQLRYNQHLERERLKQK